MHQSGELDQALDYCEQALHISREVGDHAIEASALYNIGQVHRSRGGLAAALEAFEHLVGLKDFITQPDLESYRRVLEQVQNERDAEKK